MTKSRHILAPRRAWTPDEIETVRINYADWPTHLIATLLGRKEFSVYQMANKLGLRKSAEYLNSPSAGRLRPGHNQGGATRFKPGHVSANKGLRRPGWAPGRMRETQFKKGERHGVAVRLYQPIGTERISKDGYLERKVNDDMPLQRRWRAVHLLMWEAANGQLPAGHAVAFINGDKTDIRLGNLELITRVERMRRNTRHRLPKELADLIALKGALTRKINARTRN